MQALGKATSNGTAAISGARGLGGMGKTELAYAVAQHLKGTFPDAQLVLELRGASDKPLPPEQALQTIIRTFEPLAQLPDSLTELRATYRTVLNGKRVLILADDVRDAKQVAPLLPPTGCALLLTSRQRFNLPGMETLDLGVLPQPEAENLLLEISPRIGSAASRMAQLCGRLPLALRIFAGTCANSTMSIENHLRALEDEQARLAHLQDPDNPHDPTTSVEASLRLSYAALDQQVQQVLCQLSVFPASFDVYAASAVVQVPGAEGQRTNTNQQAIEGLLNLLYRRSLLEWDRQTGRYSLHDLVRVFGLGRIEDEGAVSLRYAQFYALIAASTEELYLKGGQALLLGLKLFDQERANIDAGWNWVRQRIGDKSQEIDRLLVEYSQATTYIGDLRYDNRRERIPQLETALGATQRLSFRGEEGSTLCKLGLAYEALGEIHKAIPYYEQFLEIAREMGDHLNEDRALGNLGNAYAALGEPHKAIQYYEQQLEIAREIGDRRGEGNALGNLGNAYRNLGEPGKAIQYYEQRLEIAREMGDRRGEGNALGNLGNAYADLGEPGKAIEYYEQVLEIAREMGDRWSEGKALGNLGIAYIALGEPGKAIEYYEQDLEISQQIGNRQGEAITSWNLGGLLAKEGDLARAVELMQVMVDYEREIGHADMEKDAATVEKIRGKWSEKPL